MKECQGPAVEELRMELLRLHLKQSDLALKCGVSPGYMHIAFSTGFASGRLRMIVEWVLNRSFWSSASEWNTRQALARHFGEDVVLLTLPYLRGLAVKRGVRNWKSTGGYLCRKDLLARFVAKMQHDQV